METLDPRPPAPPQTSGLAITSLVLGLLSFSCFVFTSVPAIICGHLALGGIRRSQGGKTGEGLAVAGLVIGYLMTVLGFFVVAGLMVPTIMGARKRANQIICIRNVKEISVACEEYARDHGGEYPASFDLVRDYLTGASVFDCPAHEGSGPSYEIVFSGTEPDSGAVLIRETENRHEGQRVEGYVDLTVELVW